MKLISYKRKGKDQLALLFEDGFFDADKLVKAGPSRMQDLLEQWETLFPLLQKENEAVVKGDRQVLTYPLRALDQILAPVPHPHSLRDGYAFRQHVETARRNRGLPMIPQFDEYPVLYFSNSSSVQGPGKVYCMPDHFDGLDFELEVAIVICRQGRNIRAKDADSYIGGLTILNDFSARRLQREEMLLNLGPLKGKDFATTTGPWLVTTDELKALEVPPPAGHVGKSWDLKMEARVNGEKVSSGSLRDMDWTFAELIERASYGADLFPGDIIGSGTVGTGCFLELNGTGKLKDPDYKEQWLEAGDIVELEVQGLGVLYNTIARERTTWSLFEQKKSTQNI